MQNNNAEFEILQKIILHFPHLAPWVFRSAHATYLLMVHRNRFIISGGSYGGVYVPHIATVIYEQNLALAAGKGQSGAVHINLESMMVNNPISVSVRA